MEEDGPLKKDCMQEDVEKRVAEVLEPPTQQDLDKEYGIDDLLNGKVKTGDVCNGKLCHDVNRIDVDIHTLTSGKIDWHAALSSLEWMVEKTKDALKENDEEMISQFLAKTCIMHVIQCFHHCRHDAAPGYAHVGESIPSQRPSEKESPPTCDTDDHSC